MAENENSMGDAVTMRPGDEGSLGRIDQYTLVRELGGGGFGTVYLAKDMVSGVEYAVKGLPPMVRNIGEEMENVRANFALVSRLSHTHIARAHVLHLAKQVAYYDPSVRAKLRVDPGDTLMVMEYAPGVTLSKWRKQFPDGKVPLAQALEIVRQVAAALDYAHGVRILHRDVKPANVMVETKPDGALVARVLDFGLAAEIRSSMGRVSREIHDTSGTRPYMAPEQWVGDKQGPATDQYALAVLFHELVTGTVPLASLFDTGDPVLMMTVVTTRAPEIPADLPEPVRLALARALAKKPEERFPSCSAFVDSLGGAQLVAPATGGSRSRATLPLIIAAALALAALGGWWLFGGRAPLTGTTGVPPVECGPKHGDTKTLTLPGVWSLGPDGEPNTDDDICTWPDSKRRAEGKAVPHREITITLPGGATMEMIYVAPGTFMMGSPSTEDGRFDNETQHQVTLTKGFWLGKYEVTQAQWQSVMGNNPSKFKGDNRPVENVSWDDCQRFIRKINSVQNYGARLPTEAEWEYACRAGSTGPYAGYGNLMDMGWYGDNSGNEIHPVGQKLANAWGFHDMHGNVWEWCGDCYGDYGGDTTDPTGPVSGVYRVWRGGSWNSVARDCRSANRDRSFPGGRLLRPHDNGFRLCCSAELHE